MSLGLTILLQTLETNLFGVLNGVNTFLDVVKESSASKATSVVITGSKQGITNPPGNPAYNAAKAAVKSLAEGLDWELRNTAISVHLLVPGWTYTGLVRSHWSSMETSQLLKKKVDQVSWKHREASGRLGPGAGC